jgi:branched-chain amino acid transport system substrate-binding protein
MMTPSTGPAAEKGRPGGHGALDAWEYINTELGGVNGYQVDVQWRDSAYDSAKVVTIVNSFMDSGCLMFTTNASAEMTAAKEAANRAGFPGMATYTSPVLYHPPQHIYGQMPDYGDDWTAFAKYYLENIWKGTGKPKMALHLLNNSTGYGARDAAKAMADTLGIEIVDVEEHAATTISEMESLTRIKALAPDVLFISSTPAPTAIILKNAHDLGMYPGMTVACAHASFTKALIDLAGADIAEGVYGVFPTVTWDDTNVPGIAKAAEYCQKNNPDDYGNMDYLTCWSTSLIMAEILKNAVNSVGYDVLAKGDANAWKAIEQSGIQKLNYKVEGLQGAVSYTSGNNLLDKYVKLYTVKGGTITAIGDWVSAQ